ncbi:MAG: PAS domain-containing protein [Acidobacteria bacterium]|nr:PAS domain-containing protein [Acidobacteriota bacterium]
MNLTPNAYALIGLTALVAALVAVLTFALLRIGAAARDTRRTLRGQGMETALLSAALQEAVTKLKAQERAMAARADASERLSGEIIASLTAGVIVAGLNGELRVLNPAGRRMLDLPETEALDECRRVLGVVTLWDVIDECLRARTPIVRRSITLTERRGGVSHLGVTVSPLFDGGGQLHGAICLFTDLTAIKDLEEQVRLKHSLAAVGELTAGIAHEFRNGLATIHGYSKLFDLQALPESYRPYVEGIRAEAESLGQVVTNFLNFAKPAQLTLSRVELRSICERAADEIRADARGLGGDIDVRGDFAVVDGDEVLLRQAFSNLLRNALEACAGQGVAPRIVIHSEIDAALRASRITVDDNGPGIAPPDRDRVFRPFFTSKRNGTGLGLALVQKIIVFHNGRVAAAAASLGGASLQVTLPLAD